jgi:hypothetical protein
VSFNCEEDSKGMKYCQIVAGKTGKYPTEADCDATCEHTNYNCESNQCVKQPAGKTGSYPSLDVCHSANCGVATAWNILQAFVADMAPNASATFILRGMPGICLLNMGQTLPDNYAITLDQGKQLSLIGDTNEWCSAGIVLDWQPWSSPLGRPFGVPRNFFRVGDSASLALQGLTMRNGYTDGAGGAIEVYGNGVKLTVNSCSFENCIATADGGAVSASADFTTFTNTNFTNCQSTTGSGGALAVSGAPSGTTGYSGEGNHTLTNCIFTNNSMQGPPYLGGGGAICGNPQGGGAISLTLEGCNFAVPALIPAHEANNDLYLQSGNVTFACPPGTKGTPVTVPGLVAHKYAIPAKQLPPSTKIVQCTPNL